MTQQEVDRYAGELQRHGVESVEREVNWLSDLINAERNDPTPTIDPPAHRRNVLRTTTQHHTVRCQREGKRTPWVRFE